MSRGAEMDTVAPVTVLALPYGAAPTLRHSNKNSILSAPRTTGRSTLSTVDFPSGAQPIAFLIAASKVFASKAGMLWIRPRPWVEYQTGTAGRASGLGAS